MLRNAYSWEYTYPSIDTALDVTNGTENVERNEWLTMIGQLSCVKKYSLTKIKLYQVVNYTTKRLAEMSETLDENCTYDAIQLEVLG